MKPLKLNKNEYGLRVFCPKCNVHYNHDKLYQCKHYSHQKYKQLVYPKTGTRTKTYDSRDYDTVLIAAINFKKDAFSSNERHTTINETEDTLTVIDAINYYLEYKNGENVPYHLLKKQASKKHVEDIELNLRYFVKAIRDYSDEEPSELLFKDLDEYHVGYWINFIDDRFVEGSWNKRNSILKSFMTWIIKKFKISMYDPFEDVGRVQTDGMTETINQEEFYNVLDAIEKKDKYQKMNGKQKKIYRYRDYLKDAFRLVLYTGLRREEYLTLSWDDIEYSELSKCYLIVTDNKKVERITKKKFKPKIVPVHPKLEELLNELGWKSIPDDKKSDFIIKPKRTANVETMMRCCTNGFRHYYKQAYPDKAHKPLGCLKNTFMSLQNREVGDDMTKLSSYGSMDTLRKHYIDKKLVVKAMDIKMF
jgi:integrase